MVEEIAARRGKPHAARKAHQQLRAELGLELLDVTRQRRLRDPDLVGGASDAAFIGDLHEILNAAKLHWLGTPATGLG